MPDPINYMIDIADPFKMAMDGFQQGVARRLQPEIEARQKVVQSQADARFRREQVENSQRDVLFGQGQEDRAVQQQMLAEKQARAKAMRGEIEALSQNPNAGAEDYARVITKFPEIAQEMSRGWSALDQAQQTERLGVLGSVFSAVKSDNIKVATDLLDKREAALRADGRADDADQTKALSELIKADPEAGKTAVGLALRSLGGGGFDGVLGDGSKVRASRILANGTTIVSTDDGVKVQSAGGQILKGKAAEAAIAAANAEEIKLAKAGKYAQKAGALEADIDLGGEAVAVGEVAALQIKMGQEALVGMEKIRANIANLDRVIEALDNGAKTGALERFLPNIRASSVELENIRNKLGLDVISVVTFGALSKGELDLALRTGLPTGMDEDALRDWVLRRQVAQRKYAAVLEDLAIYMLDPANAKAGGGAGGVSGWIAQQKAAAAKAPAPAATPAPGAAPGGKPGMSFMDALGGG